MVRLYFAPTRLSTLALPAGGCADSEESDAKLIVLNAIEWPFDKVATAGPLAVLRKSTELSVREALDRLLPRSSSRDRRGQVVVSMGKASAAIVKLARARSVDLIVMGVSGSGALDEVLLGSTTHDVISRGAWPVLTVRGVKR